LKETPVNNRKGDYFLFYSRLSKEKGANTLLGTWSNLDTSIKLKIAGTGTETETLIDYKQKHKLNNVEFLGHVEGIKLTELIYNASFVIVPSEWYENNPLTVIESYAYGKPVIASDIGGLPEIVVDNKTGYLFKMKDEKGLTQTINKANDLNEREYSELSFNARKFAETCFNEESHLSSLIKIYKEAINN
jgi:glycosyltransferase involved in cell wall biosynthesis